MLAILARSIQKHFTKQLDYVFVYGSNHRLFWTQSYVLSRHESGVLRVYYLLLM